LILKDGPEALVQAVSPCLATRFARLLHGTPSQVPLFRVVAFALCAQFGRDYRADLDLIFANPDGTPLKPTSASATFSLLLRKLKLPKGASLHSLRHTHRSHLLAAEMELPAVSARLGHSSPFVTATIYTRTQSAGGSKRRRGGRESACTQRPSCTCCQSHGPLCSQNRLQLSANFSVVLVNAVVQ
jgi:hypothetical protein